MQNFGILLSYFRKGKKVAEAHKEMCEVYGINCITERTCQNRFKNSFIEIFY